MNWTDPLANNPLLVFSILCAFAALVVVAYDILNSKGNRLVSAAVESGESGNELRNKKRRPSVFDKITLLNRNLVQCPGCFRIEFATVRFCSGCGMRIVSNEESSSSVNRFRSDHKDS
jgi:hypothetical protein